MSFKYSCDACEASHWGDFQKQFAEGDQYCQHMCDDIEKRGKADKRAQGGIHHRYAGKYDGYLNAQKELGSAAKVIDTKTKKAAAKFRGWTIKQLKENVVTLRVRMKISITRYITVFAVSVFVCLRVVLFFDVVLM